MAGVPAPAIFTCPKWGAKPPRGKIVLAGVPDKIVEHHTAGHAPPDVGGDRAPGTIAIEYARALQHLHQDVNGWIDSGHSFLVMRSGAIMQGRWGTVTAIEHGRMVISAHCPGQNDQPGIEHEHAGGETMTQLQLDATVHLQAWIASHCGIRPTELYPHRRYYATACPANLVDVIPELRVRVAALLTKHGYYPRRRFTPALRFAVTRNG